MNSRLSENAATVSTCVKGAAPSAVDGGALQSSAVTNCWVCVWWEGGGGPPRKDINGFYYYYSHRETYRLDWKLWSPPPPAPVSAQCCGDHGVRTGTVRWHVSVYLFSLLETWRALPWLASDFCRSFSPGKRRTLLFLLLLLFRFLPKWKKKRISMSSLQGFSLKLCV